MPPSPVRLPSLRTAPGVRACSTPQSRRRLTCPPRWRSSGPGISPCTATTVATSHGNENSYVVSSPDSFSDDFPANVQWLIEQVFDANALSDLQVWPDRVDIEAFLTMDSVRSREAGRCGHPRTSQQIYGSDSATAPSAADDDLAPSGLSSNTRGMSTACRVRGWRDREHWSSQRCSEFDLARLGVVASTGAGDRISLPQGRRERRSPRRRVGRRRR